MKLRFMLIAIFQGNFDKTIMLITNMYVDLSRKKIANLLTICNDSLKL